MINRNDYINEYKKNKYKRISFEIPKDEFEILKKHIERTSESVNGFIKRAVKEQMKRDSE